MGKPLRVACIGGGPAGLLTGILLKQVDPRSRVDIFERRTASETYGFGVVYAFLSTHELRDDIPNPLEVADPETFERLARSCSRWNDVRISSDDFVLDLPNTGLSYAIGRPELLRVLGDRSRELGVNIIHADASKQVGRLRSDYDLVVGSDGSSSLLRESHRSRFRTSTVKSGNRYVWCSTSYPFDRFEFIFRNSPYGVFWAHAHPFSDSLSNFIIECTDSTWSRAAADRWGGHGQGVADLREQDDPHAAEFKFYTSLFSEYLCAHPLRRNYSSSSRVFVTVRNGNWFDGNVVLIGDAAHTTHFSLGSGTQLAFEDAISLVQNLGDHVSIDKALEGFEAERQVRVDTFQSEADMSTAWFESLDRISHRDSQRFAMQLMTRCRPVATYDGFIAGRYDFLKTQLARVSEQMPPDLRHADDSNRPPLLWAGRIGDVDLGNRIIFDSRGYFTNRRPMTRYVDFAHRRFLPGLVFVASVEAAATLSSSSVNHDWVIALAKRVREQLPTPKVGLGLRIDVRWSEDSLRASIPRILELVSKVQPDVAEIELTGVGRRGGSPESFVHRWQLLADTVHRGIATPHAIGIRLAVEGLADSDGLAELVDLAGAAQDTGLDFCRLSADPARGRARFDRYQPQWLFDVTATRTMATTVDPVALNTANILRNNLGLTTVVESPFTGQDDLNTLVLSERTDFCAVDSMDLAKYLPELHDYWEHSNVYHPGIGDDSGTRFRRLSVPKGEVV